MGTAPQEGQEARTTAAVSQDAQPAELNARLPQSAERVEVGIGEAAESVSRSLLSTEREYRVAVAQIATYPGHIEKNADKIIEYIAKAREAGASLVVFPELAITGYQCLDLFYNPRYIARNLEALQRIRQASAGITAIVGFVEPAPHDQRPGGRPLLYNAAAIIHDGKIVDVQHKSLLPTYEIFDEDRYFMPGKERKVVQVGGLKIGTEICEDLWSDGYSIDPTSELASKGADLIVNLSASPFHVRKFPVRAGLVKSAAANNNVPFVYANLVGGYDGYEGEVLFDGRSMVMARSGTLLGVAKGFSDDLLVVDIAAQKEMALPEVSEVEELHDALVMGIRDYFARRSRINGAPIPRAVIGLSGGIDSALVAALCVEALGPDKVLGLTMPSQYSSTGTFNDALKLAENLGIPCKVVPIKPETEAIERTLRSDPEFAAKPEDVTEENIQARVRMLNIMAFANKLGGVMVNTGNKTELMLNNCTIYGDMTGGFSVLGDVDKDRVYALSRYINERAGREIIPQTTIDRIPSAELKPDQADENVMGAPPQVLAPIARQVFEQGLTLTEALARFKDQLSERAIRNIFTRGDEFEWKSRQMPPALRVTPHAYGIGRRMPMNHGFYE